MRNHKSFLSNLYYKFLLCVPYSFDIHGKFHFSELRLSETEDKHCKMFFSLLNCVHTEINSFAGKTSRMTGFFFFNNSVIILIIYFFH